MSAITQLIERANGGDRQAAERLFAALYDEIHLADAQTPAYRTDFARA